MSKTIREHISNIQVEKSNLQHIAETGKINGSLLLSIEKTMNDYSRSQTQELQDQNAELVEILRHVVYEYEQGEQSYSTIREIKELLVKYKKP